MCASSRCELGIKGTFAFRCSQPFGMEDFIMLKINQSLSLYRQSPIFLFLTKNLSPGPFSADRQTPIFLKRPALYRPRNER